MRRDVGSYAALCRLLSDENRLSILFALGGEGQKSVSQVMEVTQLPQTLVSYHLRTLREQGLVDTERKGPFVLYRLTQEKLLDWVVEAGQFAQKNSRTIRCKTT